MRQLSPQIIYFLSDTLTKGIFLSDTLTEGFIRAFNKNSHISSPFSESSQCLIQLAEAVNHVIVSVKNSKLDFFNVVRSIMSFKCTKFTLVESENPQMTLEKSEKLIEVRRRKGCKLIYLCISSFFII